MDQAQAALEVQEQESGTILVVDDEENIVTLLIGWIETIGCEVRSASNGEEAIEAARASKPDVILMDCMMPKMSGFDACAAMKKDPELKDIPVIFLTVRNEIQDVVNGLELGAHGYLTKPFKPQELLARLRSVLRIKKLQDRLRSRTQQLRVEWAWVKTVMEQLPVAVVVTDADDAIVFWNARAEALTGVSADKMLGEKSTALELEGADWSSADQKCKVRAVGGEWKPARVLSTGLSGDGGRALVLLPE